MAKATEYRILERQTERGWKPFGVAYRRGTDLVLFCPAWRAHRTLEVPSLAELSEEHFPSTGGFYRWREVAVCRRDVSHPTELMEHAVGPQAPAPSPAEPIVLVPAFSWFAARSPETSRGAEQPETPPPSTEALLTNLEALLRGDPEAPRLLADLLTAVENPAIRLHLREALRALASVPKRSSKELTE